jgi:hypothetical protein
MGTLINGHQTFSTDNESCPSSDAYMFTFTHTYIYIYIYICISFHAGMLKCIYAWNSNISPNPNPYWKRETFLMGTNPGLENLETQALWQYPRSALDARIWRPTNSLVRSFAVKYTVRIHYFNSGKSHFYRI